MSQEAAAHALGMDRGNLSKIEGGKVPYSQLVLEAASTLYGVSAADLVGTDPELVPTRSIDRLLLERRAPADVWAHLVESAQRMTRPSPEELAARRDQEADAKAAIKRTLERARGQKRPATTSDD